MASEALLLTYILGQETNIASRRSIAIANILLRWLVCVRGIEYILVLDNLLRELAFDIANSVKWKQPVTRTW